MKTASEGQFVNDSVEVRELKHTDSKLLYLDKQHIKLVNRNKRIDVS
jgi:hypothetical protein